MKRLLSILLLLAILLPAAAQEYRAKQRLAILDPVMSDITEEGMGLIVREIVSGVFVNNGEQYTILERSLLDKVIAEAKFSNTGAVDEAQATELGKLAGADKIALTVVSKVGNRCMLSIKLINVETATIEKQHSKVVKYESLLDVVEPLTLAVLGKAPATDGIDGAAAVVDDGEKQGGFMGKVRGVFGGDGKKDKKKEEKKEELKPQAPSRYPNQPEVCMMLEPSGFDYSDRFTDEFRATDLYELYTLSYPTVSVVFDFSKAMVDGVSAERFLQLNGQTEAKKGLTLEQELNVYLPEVKQRFKDELSDNLKDMRFTFAPGSQFTLLVKMIEVDKPGRNNISDYVFFETASGKVIGGLSFKSSGGRFGGFTNLMGDAYEEEAAPKLAKAVKKQLKEIKKRRK
ncbi:MAG: CsgG/HfaB family protein [Muribaculaceae bacterium]|nr:CsgG/HfaB family protein [Muribaculaceae bacterium]